MSDALTYGNAALFFGDLQDRATLLKKLRSLRDAKYSAFEVLSRQLPITEAVRQECAAFTAKSCIEDCADVYSYLAGQVNIVDEANIRTLFTQPGTLLFEGAQGVLLDENYGFAPYTTWSTTTFANAEKLLEECAYSGEISKLSVLRAYATRHGAGPFPTEDEALTAALPEGHNVWNDWQHAFRVGYFDLVATRYAIDVAGKPDYLAITNVDRLDALPMWKLCSSYSYQGEQEDISSSYFERESNSVKRIKVQRTVNLAHQEQLTSRLWSCVPEYLEPFPEFNKGRSTAERTAYLSLLEELLSVPIAIASYGPTAGEKQYLSRSYGVAHNQSLANVRQWL